MSLSNQKVLIVGAGLVGTLAAILLAQRGARVELVERQTFQKAKVFGNRRSFNVTISSRGKAALEAAGIWQQVEKRTIPISGRMCHMPTNTKSFPYSPDRHLKLHGAQRSDVNAVLLEAAAANPKVSFRFGWTVLDLDKDTGAVTVAPVAGDGPAETIGDADFVIGADGVNSVVRRLMHRDEKVNFAQRFLDWNYREITIPAGSERDRPWRMDPNSLHIWPRGDFMMFALPNTDGSFTGNFIYPAAKEEDFDAPGKMEELFRREFPNVASLIPDAASRLRETPPSYFQTQRNSKWSHKDKFVLLGDAAHATVPFYGQGMNSGFESVLELLGCLERFGSNERGKAFAAYQKNRKPHTDAVADLSIANFDELRSNFRHALPQARRRIDIFLHRVFPKRYVPLHVKISHSLTAYQTAIDECARRDRILRYFGFDLVVRAFAGTLLLAMPIERLADEVVRSAEQIGNSAKRRRLVAALGRSDTAAGVLPQAWAAAATSETVSAISSMTEEPHPSGASASLRGDVP